MSTARVCARCGAENLGDATHCARCGAALDEPAPHPAEAVEAEPELASRRSSAPRCPNCGAHMERGTVELSARMIDVIFSGLSAHSLYFNPLRGRRREVLRPGQRKRALLCSICGGMWMR